MSDVVAMTLPVSGDLVRAAIAIAEQRGEDVADVPMTALAAAAGISRSTLFRRLGGSRRALDEAVRAAGIDPGGRLPVRERAVAAAAELISEQGLGTVTLEAVAATAGCSVHSLYVVFGGRDGLIAAVYERYSPMIDFEVVIADQAASLVEAVRGVYRAMVTGFLREPVVVPAMLADLFSRPEGTAGRLFRQYFPQVLDTLGGWLAAEVAAGRIRALPPALLLQQLIGPVTLHLLLRPVLARGWDRELPGLDETCAVLAEAFVRAVSADRGRPDHAGGSAAGRGMTMRRSKAAVGSTLFFVLAPGTLVGLVPWMITGWEFRGPAPYWIVAEIIGVILIVVGLIPPISAFVEFAQAGGTPAPVAPTEHLVVTVFNRYLRNPMYVGFLVVLVGQALLFGQAVLLLYALGGVVVVAAFVHWYEEPTLARQFGAEYERYRRAVPGWWPRLRPWSPDGADASNAR